MKKFFRNARKAAAWVADVMCLLIALAEEGVSNHVSDPFKMPKY